MILKNKTPWSDHFLRRLVAWCCEQIGLDTSKVLQADFGNISNGAYCGRAWKSMRFRVTIGSATRFPTAGRLYPGRKTEAYRQPAFADRTEALVGVTVHEFTHLLEFDSGDRNGERRTTANERRVTELFRASRESLLAEWRAEPEQTPVATITEHTSPPQPEGDAMPPKKPAVKTAAKPKAAKEAKPLSALNAAAKVLADAKEPMGCQAMIDEMAARKLWTSPGGKTPAATLYSAILREIANKGNDSRFKKTDKGKFAAAGS